jgi:AbiU2
MDANEAAEKAGWIYRVAEIAFFEAVDILGCIEALEASNQPDVVQALNNDKEGADRAAGLVQRALFGRLLMGVMTAYDPVRSGDLHLKVGMDLLGEQIPRMVVLQRGAKLEDIEAAERMWGECLNFEPLERLRNYRNKLVAHLSISDMQEPINSELFELARMTAKVGELLANGMCVSSTAVSLDLQAILYRDSSRAFWGKWKTSAE